MGNVNHLYMLIHGSKLHSIIHFVQYLLWFSFYNGIDLEGTEHIFILQ